MEKMKEKSYFVSQIFFEIGMVKLVKISMVCVSVSKETFVNIEKIDKKI